METFKEAAAEFLLQRGQHANEGGWVYGWQGHFDPRRDEGHSVACHWVATEESEVVEYSYHEFTDTFHDAEEKVLLALTHVNCQCRKVKDVTIAIEGGAMTLLHDLLGIKKEYR
jgi:hypothetical protein